MILWALILPLALAPLAAMANHGTVACCCQGAGHGNGCGTSGNDNCCRPINLGSNFSCQCAGGVATFLLPEQSFRHTSPMTPLVVSMTSPSPELFSLEIFHPPRS